MLARIGAERGKEWALPDSLWRGAALLIPWFWFGETDSAITGSQCKKRHSELILTGVLKGVKIAMGCKRMLFNEAALKII